LRKMQFVILFVNTFAQTNLLGPNPENNLGKG